MKNYVKHKEIKASQELQMLTKAEGRMIFGGVTALYAINLPASIIAYIIDKIIN